jgi:hypothetical protein
MSSFSRFPRGSANSAGGTVYGIGRQAFVDAKGRRGATVSLLDEKTTAIIGELVDGTEVEILAWVPRGAATRYRVRVTGGGVVGWLLATDLRSRVDVAAPGPHRTAWVAPLPDSLRRPRTAAGGERKRDESQLKPRRSRAAASKTRGV